jgi:hypothetical protein
MNPWELWFSSMTRLPGSGDLMQSISPLTNWFSPTVELNFAGNRQIENDVVANVASYGKQLGILTEAVNELGREDKSQAVRRLRELAEVIQKRKLQHKDDLQQQARASLETLRKADPEAFGRVLDEFQKARAGSV